MRRSAALKRSIDVIGAAAGLVATAIPLALFALAIRVTMGPPVLFRQQRPGLHSEPFVLYKLRTMHDTHDADGNLLPDRDRLTRLGRFLRATSMDELPELWNVLLGDMSLVGPRPLLMEYLPHYSPMQARRHEVRPGITGVAQVDGRNTLDWDERLALDVWYVDHWTIWLDCTILARTVAKVLRREGVNHPGHATMHRFDRRDTDGAL